MKHILFAALLLASTTVLADRVDEIKEKSIETYCYTVSQVFHDGTDFRQIGTARDVKSVTRAEFETAANENPPREASLDGIYYIDFDTYSEGEKAYITTNVQAGWDFANEFPDADFDEAAHRWLDKCMKEETDKIQYKHTDSFMHRTASNQRLVTPHSANSPQQEHCTDLAVQKYNACMIGQ